MKEIVVVNDNRVGVIAEISKVLSSIGINIEYINTTCIDSHGAITLRLTTDQYDEALRALHQADFTAITEDAFVIRLKDEPGSLAKVAKRLEAANIDIRSIQIIKRENEYSLVALATEKPEETRKLLDDVIVQ